MGTVDDPVFGELVYNDAWFGVAELPLFDRTYALSLCVPCDEGDQLQDSQREAFRRFRASTRLTGEIEAALLAYYLQVRGELAPQLDPLIELPTLADPRDLATMMWPTDLVVPRSFGADQRIIGIAFDCRWDPGVGVGVRIVDESVDEVGPQDIVL